MRGKHCPKCNFDTLFASPDGGRNMQCSECEHIVVFMPISQLVLGRCYTPGCPNYNDLSYYSSGLCVLCDTTIVKEENYQNLVKAKTSSIGKGGELKPLHENRGVERKIEMRHRPQPRGNDIGCNPCVSPIDPHQTSILKIVKENGGGSN